jgi:hypothetical protein
MSFTLPHEMTAQGLLNMWGRTDIRISRCASPGGMYLRIRVPKEALWILQSIPPTFEGVPVHVEVEHR